MDLATNPQDIFLCTFLSILINFGECEVNLERVRGEPGFLVQKNWEICMR